MFTGIVQGLCEVTSVGDEAGLRRLGVDLGALACGLDLGASVAINGVCLTAARCRGNEVGFDVIGESLAHSNLRELEKGHRVNVERSLRLGDEIGGHRLSGHVCDTVRVLRIERGPNERVIRLAVADQWLPYLSYKGFVAVDGASLTISAVDRAEGSFSVSLIPETLSRTTLGSVQEGALLNLEIDPETQSIVDTVERLLTSPEWRARLRELLA